MDIIEHVLKRFESIVNSQECECDDYHGYHCTVHDDRRFAILALQLYNKRRPNTPLEPTQTTEPKLK